MQWPVIRYAHAASHITGPVFVMSGGCGGGTSTRSDMWLCDSTTNQWIKVFHNVQFSYSHVNPLSRIMMPFGVVNTSDTITLSKSAEIF